MNALVTTFANAAVFKNNDFFQASTFVQKMMVNDLQM